MVFDNLRRSLRNTFRRKSKHGKAPTSADGKKLLPCCIQLLDGTDVTINLQVCIFITYKLLVLFYVATSSFSYTNVCSLFFHFRVLSYIFCKTRNHHLHHRFLTRLFFSTREPREYYKQCKYYIYISDRKLCIFNEKFLLFYLTELLSRQWSVFINLSIQLAIGSHVNVHYETVVNLDLT